jgi:hypothetical protein
VSDNWIIRLTPTEMMVAGYIGTARNVQAMRRGWDSSTSNAQTETFGNNIEGAAAEQAVCKRLRIYWVPVVGDPDANDAGPFQVRANCSRKYTDLCLRPKDIERNREDKLFISVLSFWPQFTFEANGWIIMRDGMRDEWFREGTPGLPMCWYVPQTALHPMSELPTVEQEYERLKALLARVA